MTIVAALLDDLRAADQKLATDPHAAGQATLNALLRFVIRAAQSQTPGEMPGDALRRLVAAHCIDLEGGVINDPIMRPKPQNRSKGNYLGHEAKLARVEPALAMELLIKAGWLQDDAAKQVVRMLGNNLAVFTGLDGVPWQIVKRWRKDIKSGADPDAKQKFDELLEAAAKFLRDRGEEGAEGLVRIAHITLNRLDHSG